MHKSRVRCSAWCLRLVIYRYTFMIDGRVVGGRDYLGRLNITGKTAILKPSVEGPVLLDEKTVQIGPSILGAHCIDRNASASDVKDAYEWLGQYIPVERVSILLQAGDAAQYLSSGFFPAVPPHFELAELAYRAEVCYEIPSFEGSARRFIFPEIRGLARRAPEILGDREEFRKCVPELYKAIRSSVTVLRVAQEATVLGFNTAFKREGCDLLIEGVPVEVKTVRESASLPLTRPVSGVESLSRVLQLIDRRGYVQRARKQGSKLLIVDVSGTLGGYTIYVNKILGESRLDFQSQIELAMGYAQSGKPTLLLISRSANSPDLAALTLRLKTY